MCGAGGGGGGNVFVILSTFNTRCDNFHREKLHRRRLFGS